MLRHQASGERDWECRSVTNTESLVNLQLPSPQNAPPRNPAKTILIKTKVVRWIDWSVKGRHENDFFSRKVKISIILWARLKRHAKAWDIPSRSILAGVAMRRRGIPLEIGSSGLNAHTYTHKKWKQQQQILKFSHFQRFRSKEKLLKEKVHFICCKAQKNEWQENLSLIVLSKLVLYIHISSFRVRFYEKKSKMTCVRVFFFVIFFECSQIARAGVQGLPHDAMLCDCGLFSHTSALNVRQSITSWQIELRRRRIRRHCR